MEMAELIVPIARLVDFKEEYATIRRNCGDERIDKAPIWGGLSSCS